MLRTFFSWLCKPKVRLGPNILLQSSFGLMIINVNDKYIGSAIRDAGIWQHEEIQFILRLAEFLISQNGSIFVYDIGANIGQHSLALASTFKDKIEIRAFEPQQLIFQMLCGNMALNNIQNVNCECALVSSENGISNSVRLPDYNLENNFGGLEFIKARYSDNGDMRFGVKTANVGCVTVDSFNEHVHLMKIDVEGMEELVLNGALTVISKSRPICYVETKKVGVEPIRAFFDRAQYKVFARGDNVVAIPSEWLINISFLDFFSRPSSASLQK